MAILEALGAPPNCGDFGQKSGDFEQKFGDFQKSIHWKNFYFNSIKIHMSTDGTKSALAWLTAGTSAVVCLGFAQTAGGRYRRPPSKKPKATDLTTAVDHGNMIKLVFSTINNNTS